MGNEKRQPAGVPVGGQFASGQRHESVDLDPYAGAMPDAPDEPPYGYDDPGEPPEGMFLPNHGFEEEGDWAESEATLYEAFESHGATLTDSQVDALADASANTSSTLRDRVYAQFGYAPESGIPALDDAWCALQNRDAVHGGTAWNPQAYREMTFAWRTVFGEFHPGDAPLAYDTAAPTAPDGFDQLAQDWLPKGITPPF